MFVGAVEKLTKMVLVSFTCFSVEFELSVFYEELMSQLSWSQFGKRKKPEFRRYMVVYFFLFNKKHKLRLRMQIIMQGVNGSGPDVIRCA